MDLQKMVGNFKLEGESGDTRRGYWESGPPNSQSGHASLSRTKAAGAY
jgi:hypothetical protein